MARSGRLRTLINSKTSYIQDADGNVFHRHPGVSWGLQAVSAPQAVTACPPIFGRRTSPEVFPNAVRFVPSWPELPPGHRRFHVVYCGSCRGVCRCGMTRRTPTRPASGVVLSFAGDLLRWHPVLLRVVAAAVVVQSGVVSAGWRLDQRPAGL